MGFKWYVSAFADYQKTYGVIGGAMVTLLWFYVSRLAMLIGAELNAVMEHASPPGKDPGERVAACFDIYGACSRHKGVKIWFK